MQVSCPLFAQLGFNSLGKLSSSMIQSKAVVAQDSGERRTERSRPGSYHYSLPVSNSHDLEC